MGSQDAARPALVVDNLTKRFGQFTLGPVDCCLEPGVTALLGANGAGKTTFMRLLVGALRPSSGSVVRPGTTGHADIGYLPQDFSAPTRVRVRDYLNFVAWCRSSRRARITGGEVDRALLAVGLGTAATARIATLSGGMVRRLGISQALLGGSDVLILDEPTVGLDPLQRQEVRALVQEIGGASVVILSTHLAEDVAAIADRVLVLDEGTVRFSGTVQELCGSRVVSAASVESGFFRVVMGEDRPKSAA